VDAYRQVAPGHYSSKPYQMERRQLIITEMSCAPKRHAIRRETPHPPPKEDPFEDEIDFEINLQDRILRSPPLGCSTPRHLSLGTWSFAKHDAMGYHHNAQGASFVMAMP
jgi:hypothetical protein